MGKKKQFTELNEGVLTAPPIIETPEQREAYMCHIATMEAERRILDGSASPSILVHYLKLASTHQQQINRKTESEITLIESKAKAVDAESHEAEDYDRVIAAIQRCSPQNEVDGFN